MNNFPKLLMIMALATAINVIARIRTNKDIATPIIGSVIVLAMLGIVGGIWRYDLVYMIAGLFLVSSLVINGIPTVKTISEFTNGVRKNDR